MKGRVVVAATLALAALAALPRAARAAEKIAVLVVGTAEKDA